MSDSTRESLEEDHPQLRFELMQADDYSKYLLHSKKEIVFLLRAMRDRGALITVYFNQGNDFLLTTLLSVSADGGAMLLDHGSNAEMNRKALASEKLTFIATHDRVKSSSPSSTSPKRNTKDARPSVRRFRMNCCACSGASTIA